MKAKPVTPSATHGHSLTLMLIDRDDSSNVSVYRGIADWNGSTLTWSGDAGGAFEIPTDALDRIRAVDDPSLKNDVFLGAEFWIPLVVGPIEDAGVPKTKMLRTGLRFPP